MWGRVERWPEPRALRPTERLALRAMTLLATGLLLVGICAVVLANGPDVQYRMGVGGRPFAVVAVVVAWYSPHIYERDRSRGKRSLIDWIFR